ncbi:MAG: ABC transporter ATP-binding protein [Deltaproteobacteria bacterium CG07_land_8_20_14_0_80_38_7]|nr:MAG: ABC transporter ATP-binding protein [Deltaproteobacteria bacterium CG07_land_8_20_14_0_80_38_7]
MIKIQGLHKSFNGHAVLCGVDLFIPRGKITVIIGPSGCGKTVLLRHIIGLLKPDRGRVTIDNVDLSTLDRVSLNNVRKRFGMLFQSAALFDSLTVFDNIAFPLREHKRMKELSVIEKIVNEKLKLVGLPNAGYKMPSELSGGMKKRVGLARAIVLEPEIVLYDEPTTGLDPIMAATIDNLILSMQQNLNITSVVISHDIESAFKVADQIAMVDKGRIIESGTPDEFRKSKNEIVQNFLRAGLN